MWSRLETWRTRVGIAVRVNRGLGVAPAQGSFLGSLWGKVCGVLAGAVGVKPGASLVDRMHVNMGTATDSPPSVPQSGGLWWKGSLPADGCVVGRSRRSTPGTGKPSTWGRAAAKRAEEFG
jgi:hypothetical protein